MNRAVAKIEDRLIAQEANEIHDEKMGDHTFFKHEK